MRLTRKTIRNIAIASTTVAFLLFVLFLVFFLASPDLDYYIVIVVIVGVTPPAIVGLIHNRWKSKIELATPEFLRDLATATKTGMPLQAALENCSKRNYGPLTIELKTLVANMSWGMSFNQALQEFSKRIDLETVRKASVLIMEAQRHGGDLSNIFESTASYVDNVNQWTAKRRTQTLPYIAIFYFSVVIFLFIIIIVSNMLFTPFGAAATNTSTLGGTPIIKPVLSQVAAQRVFLDTALLESLFGGLIAGKINEDSFLGGLKHTAILVVASGVAFYLFFR